MPLYRYGGILLKVGSALAKSAACCCPAPDCPCCTDVFTHGDITLGGIVDGPVDATDLGYSEDCDCSAYNTTFRCPKTSPCQGGGVFQTCSIGDGGFLETQLSWAIDCSGTDTILTVQAIFPSPGPANSVTFTKTVAGKPVNCKSVFTGNIPMTGSSLNPYFCDFAGTTCYFNLLNLP